MYSPHSMKGMYMNHHKKFFAGALTLPLLLAGCGNGDDGGGEAGDEAGGAIQLGHTAPPGDVISQTLEEFSELVEDGTDGRWTVQLAGAGQLGDERELIESVSMGTVDATLVSNAPIGNFVPEALFYDLPGLYQSIEHVEEVNESPVMQEYLPEALLEENLMLLATTHGGFRSITNNRGPIETIDDLPGLTMRVQESPIINATYSALEGVTPVPVPISELYTALEQGVADAQENPAILVRDFDIHEVQDYMSLTEHSFFPRYIMINDDVWETIPEEDQNVILEAAAEAEDFKNTYYVEETQQALDDLTELGMEINEPDPEFNEEFTQLMIDEVYPQFYDQIGGGDAAEGERIVEEILALAD